MLVAWEDELKRFMTGTLCSVLLKYKEIMPPIFKLARWTFETDVLISIDTVKTILRHEIISGTSYKCMTKDLRENALQACSVA